MNKIDSMSPEVKQVASFIPPIKALLGGTVAMRAAGEVYLPKFKSEVADEVNGQIDYERRLQSSTLVPYFEDTIKSMTGRVFYKPFTLDQLHDDVAQYADDFNAGGKSLQGVFESVFYEALAYSRSYVVVDYSLSEEARTRAEEKAQGARPYAFKVDIDQVLDVREKNGRLTLFKYQHQVIDEDATTDFEVVYQDEIVLMTAGLTRRYRKSDKGSWYEFDSRAVKVGGKMLEYVTAFELKLGRKPPLQNLAELNIKHWQSQSSQDNIIDTARVPILKLSGVDANSTDGIFISGGLMLPQGADAAYVEHSGAAIQAGQASLDKLEEQMGVAGAKLLTRTKMALTDHQAKSESIKEVSELMLYGMILGDFMNKVIDMFGKWLGVKAGAIDITDNLKNAADSETPVNELLLAYREGIISAQTVYETLTANGIIDDARSYADEMEIIEIESSTRLPRLTDFTGGMED